MFKVISKRGDKMNEIWVPLIYRYVKPNLYEISNLGNVRNIKTGKILKPYPSEKDYMMLCLRCIDEKSRSIKLHRIVAWHFVPGRTKRKNEVNHKDGNKQHNYASNLEWCTHLKNIHHGYKTGLIPTMTGELNGMTIYDEQTVRIICEALVTFKGSIHDVIEYLQFIEVTADKYLISDIKYKKRWRHISDEYFKREDFKH